MQPTHSPYISNLTFSHSQVLEDHLKDRQTLDRITYNEITYNEITYNEITYNEITSTTGRL